MPEVNRTAVAYRFCKLITESIEKSCDSDDPRLAEWFNTGRDRFIEACDLTAPPNTIDNDATISPNNLTKFIDKWESVDKLRFDDKEEWEDIPFEALCVKKTMVRDLRSLLEVNNEHVE